jgi:hypothetical protein
MKHHNAARIDLCGTLRLAVGFLIVFALLSLSACVIAYRPPPHEAMMVENGPAPGEVVVDQAPPGAAAEVVTVAPEPGLVWIGGYWGWYGGRYVWVSGGWHRPPRPGVVWVGGYWARRPMGGHVWVQGRWR